MQRAVWGFVLLCFLTISTLVAGQCDQRERGGRLTCCSGRNSTCAVERYETEEEKRSGGLRRKVCFCDAFCQPAGDCCPDFERVKEECKLKGVQDCVVSTWSRWTSCSHRCGVGTRKRHREVIVKPSRKGGKVCPPLRQKRGCFLKHCGERSGLAHILPKKYKRLPSKYESILPKRKDFESEKKPKRPSYCVMFKIESKHPYCQGTWARDLHPKNPICVECQDSAMDENGHCKGHGVLGELTSWVAVDIYSCHGEIAHYQIMDYSGNRPQIYVSLNGPEKVDVKGEPKNGLIYFKMGNKWLIRIDITGLVTVPDISHGSLQSYVNA